MWSSQRAASLEPPRVRTALARAHTWLWAQQHSDGSFRSATYGLLRGGQSLTAFALSSLLASPELVAPRAARVLGAIAAMIAMRSENGALGLTATTADYPCYATGMLLSCLGAAKPAGWRALALPSVAWLRTQQFRAADGWAGHPAQGGWGMGGGTQRIPPHAGHVDLSMTRRVVEGLRAAGVPANDPALVECRDFVSRCQAPDGGFFYSPVELALNKGPRTADGLPRGYGSATTDGLLCFLALRVHGSDAGSPLQRALRWLREHHRLDRNPGLQGGDLEPFATAMRGYYRAGAARCFANFGGSDGWRSALAHVVTAEQQPDGSFRNPSPLQREDDPIIATSFAIQALAVCAAESVSGHA